MQQSNQALGPWTGIVEPKCSFTYSPATIGNSQESAPSRHGWLQRCYSSTIKPVTIKDGQWRNVFRTCGAAVSDVDGNSSKALPDNANRAPHVLLRGRFPSQQLNACIETSLPISQI